MIENLKVGDSVMCAGEAQTLFEVAQLDLTPSAGEPRALLVCGPGLARDAYTHGWEPIRKLAIKDVHTEHCCAKHGCKYGDDDCTVWTGKFKQSFPCESCGYEEEQLNGQGLFAVWRIESHRDREMTFLGVFSTKVRAEKAVDDHLKLANYHKRYEYTIRDCKVNERGD